MRWKVMQLWTLVNNETDMTSNKKEDACKQVKRDKG
jgi:hypothetical protein